MTLIEVDRTDQVESRRHAHHQSSLETLHDGCSWQHFLGNELGIYQPPKGSSSAGVAYHAALEAYETSRMNGTPLPTYEDLLGLAETLVLEVIDDPEVVGAAHAALYNWWHVPMKDPQVTLRDYLSCFEPVALEPYFNVPLVEGCKPIAGWTDGVYRDKNGLFLVDHKTAKNLSRWPLDGNGKRNQATLYSVALMLSAEYDTEALVRMEYLISRTSLGKTKVFEATRRVIVKPDLHDVFILGERVREAERMQAEQDYVRKPEWNLCDPRWCPFYEGCMVTGELAGTIETVRARVSNG